jgi:hypothetical protein
LHYSKEHHYTKYYFVTDDFVSQMTTRSRWTQNKCTKPHSAAVKNAIINTGVTSLRESSQSKRARVDILSVTSGRWLRL